MNGLVGSVPLVDTLMRVLVNDYVVLTISGITLLALWFSASEQAQRAIVLTLIGFALTLAIIKPSWTIYFRARPFSEFDVKLLFYRLSMSSFPSLPIAIAFCFAEGARMANSHVGIFMYALGGLYALTRVYAGVHYPLDVAAGALIGGGVIRFVARLDFGVLAFADHVIALARRVGYA